MNRLQGLWERVRQMLWNEPALRAQTKADAHMTGKAREWMELFRGNAPWLADGVQTLNLPSAVAGELARLITVELAGSVTGGARAAYLQQQLAPVLTALRAQCEYAVAGGGLVLKPCVTGSRLSVDFVQADRFFPTEWSAAGELTGAVFIERLYRDNTWYTRLERHSITPECYLVENRAYRSSTEHTLGAQIPLAGVREWAQLSPSEGVRCADGTVPETPLFVYFKMPFANQEDTASPAGVSAYSRAVGLLEQADRQYTRILWEYEGSELAVDASVGAVQMENGDMRLPRAKQRLFRELAIDRGDGGDLYSVFSPAIRDASLFNGLDNLLRRVEFACYLSYGTLSNPQQVDKTAEEVKMSRQRSYSAVTDIQKALAACLTQLVAVMDTYASLYHLAPEGAYDVAFSFGDAVTTDTATERAAMRADCESGAAHWWEYRMKFYGETESQAKAALGVGEVETSE